MMMMLKNGDVLLATTVEIIRATLLEGKAIEVPHLGTFAVQQIKGTQRLLPDGTIVITPPRNTVAYSYPND